MNDAKPTGSAQQEFSPLRSALWPIHGHEIKKFLPMSFLMFFILFVYTMVRDLKDALVQYYTIGGGTELISQLKLWFVMPMAFLLVIVYAALINKFGFQKTFYIMVSAFMLFYVLFVTVLFPFRTMLHPSEATVKAMQASWPPFFYWIIPCITNWSVTLFYVISELWGTMAISSLFWQFAYQVTMKNEVKRFFGLYAIVGNIGVVCSGGVLKTIPKIFSANDLYIYILVGGCIGFGIATMAMYSYINSVVLKDPTLYDPTQVKAKKKKEKVGVMDGIKMIGKSRYLLLICTIVISYGVAINFCEVIWKKYMKIYFPNPIQYTEMMANLSMLTGILTIIVSLVGQNILRKTKWRTAALIPASILVIFGSMFFGIVLYGNYVSPTIFGVSFIVLAVWFGLAQDSLSKSVKYCLFDATKNMAYLPLDDDTRTKGQAAVEVIGGRAGKAGASAIQTLMISVISTGSVLTDHLVGISAILGVTAAVWVGSIFNLSKKYESKISQQNAENKK